MLREKNIKEKTVNKMDKINMRQVFYQILVA